MVINYVYEYGSPANFEWVTNFSSVNIFLTYGPILDSKLIANF